MKQHIIKLTIDAEGKLSYMADGNFNILDLIASMEIIKLSLINRVGKRPDLLEGTFRAKSVDEQIGQR